MNDYDKKAGRLQEMTRTDERSNPQDYDDVRVHQAIVHAREDLILMVSYLSSANEQLRSIRHLLLAIMGLLIWLALFK